MKRRHILAGLLLLVSSPAWCETSALWGNTGEPWTPQSRLPDYSFAGYHSGDNPIPQVPVKTNVHDFGAAGDGVTDDSEAFQKAIDATENGALLIPAGRYKITRVLMITRSHLVLRGAGPEKTILFFPKSLSEIAKEVDARPPSGSWSWSGGVIRVRGDHDDQLLARVTAPARRGDRSLSVTSVRGRHPGDRIRLWQYDRRGDLGRLLYGGQFPSPRDFLEHKLVDFSARVRAIHGKTLVLDRPLRVDVRPAWDPKIYADDPTVVEVGIEELVLEFPSRPYAGHHAEPGFNAIDFAQVEQGWIRHVAIRNADSGIFFREGTRLCTIDGLHLWADPERSRIGYGADPNEPQTVPVAGHHGILMSDFSQDNLIQNFQIDVRFIHDLGVEAGSAGNVFCAGRGVDLAIDHHRRAPYENLFTDIDAGEGARLWEYGGDEIDGPPSGVRETFWNIRTVRPQPLPSWALQANLVGMTLLAPEMKAEAGNWVEPIPPGRLTPPDLYHAQSAARKAGP